MSSTTLASFDTPFRQVPDRLDWTLATPLDPRWLTTADVARMLERTKRLVRWLARTGRLPHETTHAGQYLFLKRDVDRLVAQRATARFRGVYLGRPKRARYLPGDPRQLALFRPWLHLVATGARKEMIAGGGNRAREFAQGIGESLITRAMSPSVRSTAAPAHTRRRSRESNAGDTVVRSMSQTSQTSHVVERQEGP